MVILEVHKLKKSKLSGFSLLELVITTLIIGIFVAGGMGGFSYIRQLTGRDADRLEALGFARMTMENVLTSDFTALTDTPTAPPPSDTNENAALPAGSDLANHANGKRWYIIEDYIDQGGATVGKKISVIVQWDESPSTKQITLATLKTDTQ